MSKEEFLEGLEKALEGEMGINDIGKNIKFYSDYIDSEIRKNKPDEEVVRGLGDPRLIAKTLLETYHMKQGTSHSDRNRYDTEFHSSFRKEEYKEKGQNGMNLKNKVKVYTNIALIICVIIFILLLGSALLSLLIKIALPIVIVVFLYRILKKYL